jgi:NAD(P)-dependent dehydrogenase (short-subunit alcohol dehydrogenase family)
MKDMFKLDGKVAVVTGGAGGIGEALAMEIGMLGATVVVSSRKQEAIDAVAGKITAASGQPGHGRCLRCHRRGLG